MNDDGIQAIFNLSRTDWKYKAIIEGTIYDDMMPFKGKEFEVEFFAIVHTDENDMWHMVGRLKFHSGNKLKFVKEYGKTCSEEQIYENVLTLFKFKSDTMFLNKCGTSGGIVSILEKEDMILSKTVVEIDDGS